MNVRTNLHRLILYRGLIHDELVDLVCRMGEDDSADTAAGYEEDFYTLSNKLLDYSRVHGSQGDAWQSYLIDLLLADENPFSLECELSPRPADPRLRAMVLHDLKILQNLYHFTWANLCEKITPQIHWEYPQFPSLIPEDPSRREAKDRLLAAALKTEPQEMLAALESYYHHFGCGQPGRFNAFRWEAGLQPITHPDPITLDMIIGYDYQKQVLLDNTRAFVEGRPANNILLYGAKGTGKSSSVKALLNHFAGQGLRMVEVTRRQLAAISQITDQLRYRRHRFILFIDDLSFEDFEVDYKYIKASMEGSLEERPRNVLFYVTSNRRHLIRETWSDRQRGEEEVFPPDSQQEKLSFADRFGISLAYLPPDQELYLQMVAEMAANEGINMAPEELRSRAIQWELSHHGRSGRSARQFIDDLLGQN
ncbi:MAG TPA: ATP-binding protein [Syntrophomonas sp.]|nr:ATP-binding protein [Syntrophomonas sp.]